MKAENFQTRFKSVYSVFIVVANWLFVVNFLFYFLGICFIPGYPYNFRYLVIVFLILLCTTQFIYIYIKKKSRIKKNNYPINSINLKDYSYESCHAESSAGGTLLYISNHLSYKTRSDLCIYKSRKSESIFIEIANPKKKKLIVGCIYCHPQMDLNEFRDYYANTLLDKLLKENKTVFLLGDFI